MRYRYAVIYSWFRWRRSGTRSYIADLVDCRLWLLGGSHLTKRLDKMTINGYNRGTVMGQATLWPSHTRSYIDDLVPNHTLPADTGTHRARVRPRVPARYTPVRTHTRGASWKLQSPRRAGSELEASWKFDTSWKMCYNKAVIKERSCYYDPSRLD